MLKRILPLAALLPGMSFACSDLSAYGVEGLAFQHLPAYQAIAETLKGTPLHVIYAGEPPDGLVNANDVSGKLDEVLPGLLGQLGLTYVKNGCDISIMSHESRVFRLAPGDMIHVRLGEWLKNQGYTLYWEAPKYQASGTLALEKSLDDTLAEVVSLMGANGMKLSAEIYENRAVRITEIK